MPRRREVQKRKILPDPKYHDVMVTKFVNGLMKQGKKSVAESIMYGALDFIAEHERREGPLTVFKTAMENAKPVIEVKSRRVGGSTYQVPVEIRANRRESLAVRWLIDFASKRPGKNFGEKLAGELLDAYDKKGMTIKKREDVHKMAEANKAFAHYRW
ncbi:MAG: 30S ribosomal protein S7 [Deltaproteobacteria bacterium RIFOXYA12_FULL_61_11]|nr:MAG: 30S ribosomal protein S7 [Deltaproteobacteria bacterium RIFOXYA12_FULL_61_11]